MSESTIVLGLLHAVFVYYICLHTLYLMLIMLGTSGLRRYQRGIHIGDFRRIAQSPLTLPFSVVIPAYNEERIIVHTVEAALKLRYPEHEVIVVNDGSTDATMESLIRHFGLRRIYKVGATRLKTQALRGIYESLEHPGLLVIDKDNGRRADAINAAANYARFPLLCIMDADCIFEEDALLRAVRPFLRSGNVIAVGGIVRPANGLSVRDGRIESFGLPKRLLPLMQAVEYMRSFQWARIGLARLDSMLSISGAFMVVKKQVFVDMGGVDANAITDDIDFTIRLYKYAHEHSGETKLEIDYVPDPVCYTEVPETLGAFATQRNRWERGTLQALFRNARMTFNPRYGLTGLFGMPFFLLFEGLAAIVETVGYVVTFLGWELGLLTNRDIVLFLILAVVLGTFLSVAAVLLQERTRMRAVAMGDLLRLLAVAFTENLGYHQMHLLIRLGGSFDYLVRRRKDVESSERYGAYIDQPSV